MAEGLNIQHCGKKRAKDFQMTI